MGVVDVSLGELPHIVLASASPRRRLLLESVGVAHSVRPASVDDGDLTPGGGTDPAAWVASLAFLKASSCVGSIGEGDAPEGAVVLGADTVCVHQGAIIGKPVDEGDARRIIHAVRGGVHEVLTGVAVIRVSDGARDVYVDRSVVTVGEIVDDEVESYLASGEWRGKAGAYNIRDRLDAGWDIVYDGDEHSIAGLPLARVLGRIVSVFC